MPRYSVIFDRDAETDLLAIRGHVANARGAEFALEFVERIVTYCQSFADLPHRGTRPDEIWPACERSAGERP